MMRAAYAVSTVRALEEAAIARVGNDTLMQRAAAGLAAVAAAELARRRGRIYGAFVAILVGPGNNGGDALYAGARLARRGARVTAVRCVGEPHPAGTAALKAAGGRIVDPGPTGPAAQLGQQPEWDLAIDGVFGIGGRPGLPDRVADCAALLAGAGVPVIAVDLPSGVEADTGAVPGESFRADRTVTFGLLKSCHLIQPGRSRCGAVDLVDIGLAASNQFELQQVEETDLAAGWPFPDERSDKYSRGVVGIDTGSDSYPGAGVLSTYGAVHAGAGMVRFLGASTPAELIRAALPNVVFSAGQVQAHLFGCGWGDRADGRSVLQAALESGLPTVVDADGLRHLPDQLPPHWLLTPHAGELARLLGIERSAVTADPSGAVRTAVSRIGATVLLKGATQLVGSPGRDDLLVALPGPAWTGQAGSGDVLAGICAALLAAGRSALDAAALGASIQAATASRHPGPVPPHRLAELLSAELGRLQRPDTSAPAAPDRR